MNSQIKLHHLIKRQLGIAKKIKTTESNEPVKAILKPFLYHRDGLMVHENLMKSNRLSSPVRGEEFDVLEEVKCLK
ncbi:MAG: hypothetical protein ACPL28_00615 [bacterium]